MKKFDFLTPIGLIFGLGAISLAIIDVSGVSGGAVFISLASVFTVFGGLFGSLLVNFSWKDVKNLTKVVKQAFYIKDNQLDNLILIFQKLSIKARREGLLALEQELEEVNDPFIRKGVLLAVDGIEPELIKEIMMAEVLAMEERHQKGIMIIDKAGDLAPAWGMIGTVIGLVLMLQHLDDPSTLGPNMALALITTFYGAVLANLIFIPLSGKLRNLSEEEAFLKQIMIEGILGVQSGQNPKLLEEKLSAFLPPIVREKLENATQGEGALADEA